MTQTKNKQIADRGVFFKRLNDLLISLTALSLTIGTIVLIAAIGVLLSGCATSPKYEVARTDRWIVKDGYVVGEKDKPNAVKEGNTNNPNATAIGNNDKYCENEVKPNNDDDRNNKLDRISRFNDNRRFNNESRDRGDLNDTNRNATLALYKGKPIEAVEEAWVRSVLPNTQIELIRRSPAANFYTAFLSNGRLIYVNPSQRLLFFGEIYTNNGENLTNISRERFNEIKASQTALEINATELETLGFGEISGDKFAAMVYSPLCPYCHKADEFFANNHQIPVKRIFMIDLQSPNDEGVKRSIEYLTTADRKEREALLVKWRSPDGYEAQISVDGQIDENVKEAVALLTRMNKFAERNKIDGTPYIYLVNRADKKVERVLSGFNASTAGEQIKAWFANNENQANGEKQ
jgi:thiol:disulfide interchange protein DsbC